MSSPSDLDARLREGADRLPVGEPPVEAILRGGRRRLLRRRLAQGGGVALALALVAGLLIGLRGLGSAELHLSDGRTIHKAVVLGSTPLPADAFPVSIASADGSVWIVDSSGTGRLIRLDEASGRVVKAIPLEDRGVSEIAVEGSSVFVAGFTDVVEVDARTDTVVRRYPMPANNEALQGGVQGLAVGFGSVWTTLSQGPDHLLVRVDRSTGRVVAKVELPLESARIVIAGGSVWVTACTCEFQPPTLYRVDPATDTLVQTLKTPGTYRQYGSFQQLTVDGPNLWAISGPADAGSDSPLRSWLWQVDPATGTILHTPAMVGLGTARFALAGGAVWVVHAAGGTNASVLSLIDPGTGRIVGPGKPVGSLASGIVEGNGLLWVTSRQGVDPVVYRVRP